MTSRHFLFALGSLLCATAAHAQFELKAGTFNSLRQAPVNTGGAPAVFTPQFAARAVTSATAGAIDATPANPNDNGAISADHHGRYPAGRQMNGVQVTGGVVLMRASFGGVFASGVPRYFMGDEITRPVVASNGSGTVDPSYWRRKPVIYGEVITQPGGAQDAPYNPNFPDPVPDPASAPYYYSPHANKVFAHQPGRVTIRWVTQSPVGPGGTTGAGDNPKMFRYKDETFSVSSGTTRPVRTIYWTERTFNSPKVNIPTGRIVTVNPVYNTFLPKTVGMEYQPVGSVPNPNPSASPPPELRTLWFENTNGLGQLRAYNSEGRIFMEYLGPLLEGENAQHEFLGADIVDVVQVPESTTATVKLGERIRPHDITGLVPDNADSLQPSAVINLGETGPAFYGTSTLPDGSLVYHAERENDNPDKVVFYWLEEYDAAIHFQPTISPPDLGIYWPKYLNKYLQSWPAPISEYAGVTVEDTGSGPATGIQFSGGGLPQVVYQDDVNQTEVSMDLATQRLIVDFSASNDKTNRSLLRFNNGGRVWYVRLFIQSQSVLGAPAVPDPDGAGPLTGTPAIFALADLNADGVRDLVDANVVVGQRIERPDSTYELAGYISNGTHYHVGAYKNPFIFGVAAAGAGAIIPVNAKQGSKQFTIWWFKKVEPLESQFEPFYVPAKSGRYTVNFNPGTAEKLVLASNLGSGDLSPAQAAGEIYTQNDSTLPGFNPNEEHALMLSGRAYAMRDDLNVTSGAGYTSDPFVLISYTDPADNRPAVRTFSVVRELDLAGTANDKFFNYPVTAGATIPAPMPLPLLPLPVRPDGTVPNTEVPGTPDPAPHATAPDSYDPFTIQDRKGFVRVFRGPHAGGSPTLGMRFYYAMRDGFFIPGMATQPPAGTVLPYLRPAGVSTPLNLADSPLTIIYRPSWPTSVPELRVGETLTLAKFGLPQVRGQTSAKIVYQQSVALTGTTTSSATLHDPTRAKKVLLSTIGLTDIPAGVATTIYNGRTYFQRLPPHLQPRFYMTPALGGELELVLEGTFVDEISGEDYLNLNVLSAADLAALEGLADSASSGDKSKWAAAIAALKTKVDTFIEDPAKKGTYKVGSFVNVDAVTPAVISDSDTAVDSYALTSTGAGAGYVTLLLGDGRAFTPAGDPIAIEIIKVVPQLYVGDLKVQFSSNPLDEQVSLRHSGDFAARPQDYEFEWRYAQPVDGVAPPSYAFGAPAAVLGAATQWTLVQNPAAALPSQAEYAAAGAAVPLPRSLQIQDPLYAGGTAPGVVLKSATNVDFSGGKPGSIIFSADNSGDLDGFVVYVNGIAALGFRAPAPFVNTDPVSGLSATGLMQQFRMDKNFFTQGVNTIEIALFSAADPLVSSTVNFRLETTTEQDRVDPVAFPASPWLQPTGTLLNQITVGGSPSAPLGDPLLLLQDNYFTMRYRAKAGNVAGTSWSRWMEPKLVPGWIKRVLDAINPFNQRMLDLFNNAVNTDVSVITQAGTRWEGNIALNLENINDAGLIEIYETVLNRGRLFSIDNGYDTPGTNDALLLAAGYLNDLYVVLGNEAYADAANPTISLDDQDTITEVNSSRYSFEGQVASVLDEELSLLRGRDDFLQPSVTINPAYNRLFWNYTNGINSGEVLYAVNYNIKEKAGSSTANGIIDAADAQRMFPQGHGDAYGHYLTALKGYYKLITHPNFTWTPRIEAVVVLGQNVSVDYSDERKFSGTAASLARAAEQILALTFRKAYRDDPAAGWSHLRDNTLNSRTDERRQWGVDEWASRSSQGAYFNWVVGNAMLPDVDNNPQHTGIQKVDRSTVPELGELVTAATSYQNLMDNANAHLNPLGLSSGAVAFDISPAELKAGKSHFEQVHERALNAVLNAKGSFDQAGRMTRLLRNQENQIDDYNTSIQDQERAFTYQLIDLFGTPYTFDIGPGKTYAQGYTGPDLEHWFIVDQASELVDVYGTARTVSIKQPLELPDFQPTNIGQIYERLNTPANYVTRTVVVQPNRLAQSSKTYFGLGATAGQRTVTGEMQAALVEAQEAQMLLVDSLENVGRYEARFEAGKRLFEEMVTSHNLALQKQLDTTTQVQTQAALAKRLENAGDLADALGDGLSELGESLAEFLPEDVGFANDVTSAGRGALRLVGTIGAAIERLLAVAARGQAGQIEAKNIERTMLLDRDLASLGYSLEQRQFIYEYEVLFNEVVDQAFEVALRASAYQRATEKVRNVLARGDRILAEREIFRRRAAALIQGYRTRDLTFRTFRNEALEQYRTLYDLAARYTCLSAKSYDYETGLLGTTEGKAVISSIVASRSLGDLTNGVPQATTSTLGDSGLAGVMARLNADFSVAEGRLGINNPDQNGTLVSLRHELFRIVDDPAVASDDEAWQQTLEQHIVSDLMSDPDAASFCRNLRKADGSRVPGIVIPFSSTIQHGQNFFGLPLAGGDHAFTPSNFATKIYSVGMVLKGYVGMDPYAIGTPGAGAPATGDPNSLAATPYVYLIPTGTDYMLAPPLGDTNTLRAWNVHDQALPLPYNLGATAFNGTQFFKTNGTLSEQPWILRKHQAFRPVSDPAFFYSLVPQEFTSSRLVGRSVWNSGWKIVIPAYSLLNDEQQGLNRFVRSVKDIQVFLRTYSHSGN